MYQNLSDPACGSS